MNFKPLFSLLAFLLLFQISALAQETSCNNGIDDDNDGFVDCYDSDCNGSADCAGSFFGQSASCQYVPSTTGFGLRPKWNTDSLTYDIFSTVTPISGDWDNDGVAEVFAYNHNGLASPNAGPGTKIYVINGIYGTVEDSIVMPVSAPTFQTSGMALGDMNNDGFAEIVIIGADSRLRCYDHLTNLLWTSPALSPALTPVVNIADFNQDGNPEVYCSAFVFNGQTGAQIGVGAFPTAGAVGAPIVSGGLVGLGMTVAADVLPTGFCADCAGLELIAGNKVFSVNVGTGNVTVQMTANAPGYDGFTAIADYDKDGDLDGIISTDAGSPGQTFVFVWDLQTPTIIAQSPIFTSSSFWTIGQCNVGDFDGDGLLEVGVVTEDVYRVLDDFTTGLALLWSKTTVDESGFTGSVLFDFQGDGIVEVVYQDEDSLYVYEGNTGNTLASIVCRGGTVANHPIILDVDGDDQAEIVCGCSEGIGVDPRLHGYIQAFGPNGNAWLNAREVWNQHSYWITNINDDLSVPIQQQNHHIIGDSVVINGFNIQSTQLTSSGQPTYAASDAIVTITTVDLTNCGVGPNTIDVSFEICNQSPAAVFPRGTPASLYNGDPTLPGATFIDSVHISASLPDGGCQAFILTIPDQGGLFDLWIVVNDTGHSVTPVAFPTAGVGECDFTNNFDFLAISCGSDHDLDGIPDATDIDDDNDGIPDLTELGGLDPDADVNSNGMPDWMDAAAPGFTDTNSDGVDDRYDSDFDGVPNHYDIDADNDGLADAVEANGGAVPAGFDNASGTFTGPVGANGMPDNSETAVDNGVTILALSNSDGDPLPDYLDIDADNDGIVDNVEIQTTVGYVAPSGVDLDANGRDDAYDGAGALTATNTDGTTTPDYIDLDADDDGVPDAIEGHDANMDGIPDNVFSGGDTDGDGLDDAYDNVVLGGPGQNATGSNAPLQNTDGADDRDWRDIDDDNDGILTANEDFSNNNNWADDFTQGGPSPDYLQILDLDQDGITDLIDIDDDNDGIPDLTELGGLDPNQDSNSNGIPDYIDPTTPGYVDTNFDGVDDRYDSDRDGVPNHLDIDADNDGLADAIEANGGVAPASFDNATGRFTGPVGANGMPDNAETAVDNGVTILALTNSDGDPLPDYLDIDADNDGIVDNVEIQPTVGYVAPSGIDANNNGRDDAYDGAGALTATNTDGTTTPDYIDLDADDDGVLDAIEGHDANMDGVADASPTGFDADNDGLDDAYDNVVLGGPGQNATGSNAPLQNTDGADDRDWRDIDDDNDGILTANEDFNNNNDWSDDFTQGGPSPDYLQILDLDQDGITDLIDIDDDNDGIPDLTELGGLDPNQDSNSNGIPDYIDPTTPGYVDTNFDGVDDRYDSDRDGVPNHLDIDADNDGLADAIEANGGVAPAGFDNATGRFTGPVGANGMPDNAETAVDNGVTILALTNSDGDPLPDYLDIDADNDGIVDNVEVQTTAGYVAISGLDANNNGRDDAYDGAGALTATNTDGTTTPDYIDLDSDDDGVPDLIEGHDANMDGVADNSPSGFDTDGDGLDDAFDTLPVNALGNPTGSNAALQNTDGADDRDWRDIDDDNDGILTANEDFNTNNDWADDFTQGGPAPDYLQVPDIDGDGIPNVVDIDDDNDGIPDLTELGGLDPNQDTDADGIPDWQDPTTPGFVDVNTDGIDDRYDSDFDGVPNHYDIDADNDGLADAVEANGGGVPAGFDNASGTFTGPVGANGMPDNSETAVDNGVTILPLSNSDGDVLPDYLDIDADNDGIVDNIEVQTTVGYLAPSGADLDGNGRDDVYDGAGALTATNTDAATVPDYLDLDSDNDGVPDLIEGHDANMDGVADNSPSGFDSDNDGLDDAFDNVVLGGPGVNETGSNAALQNTDGADDRDWRDIDDDNDGIPTALEDFNTNNDWSDDFTQGGGTTPDYLYNPDHDNDGIADVVDIDDDNDGIQDLTELGGLNPDADGNSNGIVDWLDSAAPGFVDANSDGVDDRYDSDRDGIPNHWDIDADGDGMTDAIEANGGVVPAGFDNTTGSFTGPVGANGMPDNAETAVDNGVTILPITNGDGDVFPDYLDIDADNDGIVDNIEFQATIGYVVPTGNDLDGNGRDDAYDGASALVPVDTDSDGTPDFRDQDSENDGVPDFIEGHDANWDGLPDNVFSGVDSDGDGLDDAFDNVVLGGPGINATGSNAPLQDTDLDALTTGDRDWRDIDDDDDGIPTGNGTPGSGEDFNANGDWSDDFTQGGGSIPDYLFNFNLFPVTLTHFDAELHGKDGLVKWVTEMEINNDYFRVFRSVDGQNYVQLGMVDGAGNSQVESRYEFVDRNIAELGVNTVWYRLEQVDLDGNYESYGPVALTIAYGDPFISLYPNPTTGNVLLDMRYLANGGADVYCINKLGQMVFQMKVDINAPIVKQSINLEGVSGGVYTVVVVTKSGRFTQKLRVVR